MLINVVSYIFINVVPLQEKFRAVISSTQYKIKSYIFVYNNKN